MKLPGAARRSHERALAAVVETELGPERKCLSCGEMWPIDPEFFHRQVNGHRGFQAVCIACRSEIRAKRAHRNAKYPASSRRSDQKRGVPKYAVLGPCPCSDCGVLLWYAHSQTRDGWNGEAIKGLLKWRQLGGKVHACRARKAA
jgi:hypothetical protein